VTNERARYSLLALFVCFLVVHLAAFAANYKRMWPDEFQNLVVKTLAIYSVPLSVIMGSIFAQGPASKKRSAGGTATAALTLSACWNLLLAWRSISFAVAAKDHVTEVITYLDTISASGSFLIAGVLAFYFSKSSSSH
jgi:hypothetical protein